MHSDEDNKPPKILGGGGGGLKLSIGGPPKMNLDKKDSPLLSDSKMKKDSSHSSILGAD